MASILGTCTGKYLLSPGKHLLRPLQCHKSRSSAPDMAHEPIPHTNLELASDVAYYFEKMKKKKTKFLIFENGS